MKGATIEGVLELIQKTKKNCQDESCSKRKIHLRQWVMFLNFVFIEVLVGMAYGYSPIILQQLKPRQNSGIKDMKFENGEIFGKPQLEVDSIDTQSWIASSMVLLMSPGCWVLAACSNKLGRKPILLFTEAAFTISWILIAFANNTYHIIIGRSLCGLCIGILTGLNYVYQGECTISEFRSIFNTLHAIAFSLGIELCHVLGFWFHWRTTALFASFLGVIALPLHYRLPESPIWLLGQNRVKSALESWIFLKGKEDFDELEVMSLNMPTGSQHNKVNEHGIRKFCSGSFLKPLGLVLTIFTTAQMSGISAVAFYCTPIISDIAGAENAHIPTLILDTLRLVGSVVVAVVLKRFSLRKLILFSGSTCSIVLFSLALAILFDAWSPWLQLILLFAHESAVVLGLGPLPYLFCNELFSGAHKEVGLSIGTNYSYLMSFSIVKVNPYLFSIVAPWRTFLLYSAFTLVGTIILHFILPETKNKSPREVELLFS